MPRLLLEPEAEDDLEEAFAWYERQRPWLGGEFFAEVALVLQAIEQTTQQYPIIRGQTRRALVHRFPYAVFFVVDPDLTAVTAVMHGRRDPRRWQKRRRRLTRWRCRLYKGESRLCARMHLWSA